MPIERQNRITVASEVSAAVARSVMVRRAAPAGSATTSRATRCSAGDSDGSRPLIATISPVVSGVAETFAVFATAETYFQAGGTSTIL